MENTQIPFSSNRFNTVKQRPFSPVAIVGKKRLRDYDTILIPHNRNDNNKNSTSETAVLAGSETPTLIDPRSSDSVALKKLRSEYGVPIPMPSPFERSSFLRTLPDDVVGYCLSFLGSTQDRNALQCTCRKLRRLSNSNEILLSIKLGGDTETGLGGLFSDSDTINSAVHKVSIFARAGNVEALYILGMIKTFCQPDVEGGILILQRAAKEGFVRAHYTLGLVLRDSHTDEANRHMSTAAKADYLPALQEVLPNRDMKPSLAN
eukprot:CAMPEP_0194133796 /NCGR_PEP_ID=MMETSP0152-20130528/3814_1 /TAXON_ID=1049557 /ORGANISM="Thalassiothrix antarctica, Strain L6-D1" /LENGTH=262 /DNA_ID=CAMNT_0038829155 /DNA_START=106 /DNA_END=895 /DNA_ORIENTATION=-